MSTPGLYAILGVYGNATTDQIRRAYYTLAKQYHPDHLSSNRPDEIRRATDKFKQIHQAYTILMDPRRRRTYDITGEADVDLLQCSTETDARPMSFDLSGFADVGDDESDPFKFYRASTETKITKYVGLFDLVMGCTITIQDCNGDDVTLNIPRLTKPGSCLTAAGKSGSIIVNLEMIWPTEIVISEDQLCQLQAECKTYKR
jgi:DnaJ-class molecular chaperone